MVLTHTPSFLAYLPVHIARFITYSMDGVEKTRADAGRGRQTEG